jgi:glutamyl-Q tRNA(Asp) synthetase
MEDLDTPRVVPGIADDMLRTLEALGLLWDGEVLYQSQRSHLYEEAVDRLRQQGVLYPCGCSRGEIARSASAPHPSDSELIYPGTCRDGIAPGKSPRAWRLRVPAQEIVFTDLIQGEVREELASSSGDFVIRRADGPFAYQLAVVVDDGASGITQVVRGADLLSSTPRQIYLQRLLGFPTPTYAHLPLVSAPSGGKLSKRDSAVSLAAGRDLAFDGGRLVYAALSFLGQSPPLELTAAPPNQLLAWGVTHFDPLRVPRRIAPFPRV